VRKVLILRFSSLGDILQCFPAAAALKADYPEIHWLTREDFAEVVRLNPYVTKTLSFNRTKGLIGLIKLAFQLREQKYDLIYDAHNNLRSHIICAILRWNSKLVRRKKFRFRRYFLFRWRWNLFGKKILGQETFLEPLGVSQNDFQLNLPVSKQNYVALVPGAAWPLKLWPRDHWLDLIHKFPNQKFVIIGGKSDQICFEIESRTKREQVTNLAGQLSLVESIQKIAAAKAVIANDTGLLHAADLLGLPTVALIGPSAFGYPTSKKSHTLEVDLWCKPCSKDGRGRCRNKTHMKCMIDIDSKRVAKKLAEIMP
jgi:ADP-heptose:LPS heptosyltransferase